MAIILLLLFLTVEATRKHLVNGLENSLVRISFLMFLIKVNFKGLFHVVLYSDSGMV